MKRYFLFGILIAGLALLTLGCNPVSVVEDERSVGTQIDDATLAAKVKYELVNAPDVNSWDVEVKSYDRHVDVMGVVENGNQADRATEIARNVPGVRSVTPFFLIKGSEDTFGRAVDDTTIATKVKARLIDNPKLKSGQFDVEVLRGHVLLFGIVSTKAEMDAAVGEALSVKGVRDVQSYIIH